MGLEGRVKILSGDMFKTDLRPATVVTLYHLTVFHKQFRPLLERDLRPASVPFPTNSRSMGGIPSRSCQRLQTPESHTLYLYGRP